jgi:hypothetical protein
MAFSIMTVVTATYKPQGSQTFRCSSNFPNWNNPVGGQLMFQVVVPTGYPQPYFAIEHDKVGQDTRWYSNISNGVIVPCSQGGSGSYNLYVGTTSELPDGLNGAMNYVVIVSAAPAA